MKLARFLLVVAFLTPSLAFSQTATPTKTVTPTPTLTVTRTPTPTVTATPVPQGPSIFAVRGLTGTNGSNPTYWGAAQRTAEDQATYILPFDAKLSKLTIGCTGTASGGGTVHTWTVRVNNVDTALAVALTDSGPATSLVVQDWTHDTGMITAGDLISIREVDSTSFGPIYSCDVTLLVQTPAGDPAPGLIQVGSVSMNPSDGSFCGPGPSNSDASACGAAFGDTASWVAPVAGNLLGIAVITTSAIEAGKSETFTVRNVTQACDSEDVGLIEGEAAAYTNTSVGCTDFDAGDQLAIRFNRTGVQQSMNRRIIVMTDAPYGYPILGDTLNYPDDAYLAPGSGFNDNPARRWRSPVEASLRYLRVDTKADTENAVTWRACVATLGAGSLICNNLQCTVPVTGAQCSELTQILYVPQGGAVMMRYDTTGATGALGVAAGMAFGPPLPTTTPTPTATASPTRTATPTVTSTAPSPTPTRTSTPPPSATPTPTSTGLTPTPRRTCRNCANEHFGQPVPTPTPCAACPDVEPFVRTCCQLSAEFACTIEFGFEGCPVDTAACIDEGGTATAGQIASCRSWPFGCQLGVTGCPVDETECEEANGRIATIGFDSFCYMNACVCEAIE